MSHYTLKGNSYCLCLLYWTLIALIIPNIILSFTENLGFLKGCTNVLLPFGVYWLLVSSTRNTGKAVLWMLPLTFLAAFELVLLFLYGRSVIAVDMWLNLVTTNASEASELLEGLIPVLCLVAVLYLIPLILAVAGVIKKKNLTDGTSRKQRTAAIFVTCIGGIMFGLSFFIGSTPYRPGRDLFPVNAVNNGIIAVKRFQSTRKYPDTSRNYRHYSTFEEADSGKACVTVIVIGETSRATNWALAGYDRPTNPRLSERNDIFFFPKTMSESNTTHKSVPMLLTNVDARTFADSLGTVKGIISAFGEAGFNTAFYSAQKRNHSYIDFLGGEADICDFVVEDPDFDLEPGKTDKMLLDRLRTRLSDNNKRDLIVLHTYGSHYSYIDRYPEKAGVFLPDRPIKADKDNRPVLVNAYDNTIVRTDSILSEIINIVEDSGRSGSVIYTSDHGEDIYDDERGLFLHASPVPSYWQLHVPMLVWLSRDRYETNPDIAKALGENRSKDISSSISLYHTALQLGGVKTCDYRPEYSLGSDKFRSPKRVYLTDHNEAVDYQSSGLDSGDFEQLGTSGISSLE